MQIEYIIHSSHFIDENRMVELKLKIEFKTVLKLQPSGDGHQ